MKKKTKLFLLFAFVLAISSCSSPKAEEEIVAMEKDSLQKVLKHLDSLVLDNRSKGTSNSKIANETVKSQLTYAAKFPLEKDAAKYMFKASDIAINELHQASLSAKILTDLIQKYPDFKEMSVCYFQLGMMYENYLQDTAKAKMYYKTFLEKYPNDELAEQVKTLLTLVGKNLDDITKGNKGK